MKTLLFPSARHLGGRVWACRKGWLAVLFLSLNALLPLRGQIVAAEYFMGEDPGDGQGIALATGESVGGAASLADLSLPNNFAPGTYNLQVRVQNADGVWSLPALRRFTVLEAPEGDPADPSDPVPAGPAIVAAEYFMGEDPGEGQGIALAIGESVGGAASLADLSLPNNFAPGTYSLQVRVQNADGIWSLPALRRFTVLEAPEGDPADPSDPVPAGPAIVAAEYFINVPGRPGEDQPLALDSPLLGSDPVATLTEAALPIDHLRAGTHTIGFRVQNELGDWSEPALRRFTMLGLTGEPDLSPPELTLSGANPLTWLQHQTPFIEPGYSASDDVDGDLTGQVRVTGDLNLTIPGTYTLTYTVADFAGNLSRLTREVEVLESPTGEQAPSITTQPVGGTVDLGGSLRLSVTATGTAPLTYTWKRGTEILQQGSHNTLDLTNLTTTASYTVSISNTNGSVESTPVTVIVRPARYTLSVEGTNGSVQITPVASDYEAGSSIELLAVPDSGFVFVSWSGDLSGTDNPLSFNINQNTSLEALFTALPVAQAGEDVFVMAASGASTATVSLDGSASAAPSGLVSWEWTWAGGSLSGEQVSGDFPVGSSTVTLTVRDLHGVEASDELEVTVFPFRQVQLTAPAAESVLANAAADGSVVRLWSFAWESIPEASAYQLEIRDPDNAVFFDDASLLETSFDLSSAQPISDNALTGWTWRARAQLAGLWSVWSSPRAFSVHQRRLELTADGAFGDVIVGQSQTRTFTLRNTGSQAVTVRALNYPEGFSGSFTGTLAPGASQSVNVTFAPTAVRAYSGNFSILSDVSSAVAALPLSGNGLDAPRLQLTPSALTFPGEGGGDTLQVFSNLSWAVSSSASWLSLSATNGTGDAGLSVTAQSNTELLVRTATLTFTAEGLGSPQTVVVTQESVFSGQVAITGADAYRRGSRVSLNLTIPPDVPDFSSGLGISLELPQGWSLVQQNATANVRPVFGDRELLEWVWSQNFPNLPYTFSVELQTDFESAGDQVIGGSSFFNASVESEELDLRPRVLRETLFHSADFSPFDYSINLQELLSVIVFYNYREDNVRKGFYHADPTKATGYSAGPPDPEAPNPVGVPAFRPHSSDYRDLSSGQNVPDGRIDINELLRLVQYYNYRVGNLRTGEYHPASGTADGFLAGPPTPPQAQRARLSPPVARASALPEWELLTPGGNLSAAGGEVTVQVRPKLSDAGTVAVALEVVQPEGWSYVSGTGQADALISPQAGDLSPDLGWIWIEGSGVPETFTFTLRYPANSRGQPTLRANIIVGEVNIVPLSDLPLPTGRAMVENPTADPLRRGISNLLAHALGIAPDERRISPYLPQIARNPATSDLIFSFRQLAPSDGLRYILEVSDDLQTWLPFEPADPAHLQKTGDPEPGIEEWQATLPQDPAKPSSFLRLRVTEE